MNIVTPPQGVSLDRLMTLDYHVDFKFWPWGVKCGSCGKVIEPDIKWNAIGDDWSFTMPPPVGDRCDCGGTYERGAEKFIAFVYRGGRDLETHEAVGACVDVGSAWENESDAAEEAKIMVERQIAKRTGKHYLVSGG